MAKETKAQTMIREMQGKVVQLHEAGGKLAEIVEATGLPNGLVREYLRGAGIKLRGRGPGSKAATPPVPPVPPAKRGPGRPKGSSGQAAAPPVPSATAELPPRARAIAALVAAGFDAGTAAAMVPEPGTASTGHPVQVAPFQGGKFELVGTGLTAKGTYYGLRFGVKGGSFGTLYFRAAEGVIPEGAKYTVSIRPVL